MAITLKEYIDEYRIQTFRMDKFFLTEWLYNDDGKGDFIKVIEENLLAKHTEFLSANKLLIELTDDEWRKYRCNLHRFSYDLYGTTELWFLLLHANELYSESEFNTKRCFVYNVQVLSKLTEILNVEAENIKKNRADVAYTTAYLKKAFDN